MIRAYRSEDRDALLEVWQDASNVAHSFLSAEVLTRERKAIRDQYLDVAETWVFEDAGHVVGFLSLIGDEVGGLFVAPRRHGQGIGRALMDHARMRRRMLEVEVFRANAIGRRFYDRYGFVAIGQSVHEPTGETVVRMRLPELAEI